MRLNYFHCQDLDPGIAFGTRAQHLYAPAEEAYPFPLQTTRQQAMDTIHQGPLGERGAMEGPHHAGPST
jgi:hypothetical protein